MNFLSKVTTSDGKLTTGKVYTGQIVVLPGSMIMNGLRVAVFDNNGDLNTFNPGAFKQVEQVFTPEQVGQVAGGTVGNLHREISKYREAFRNEQHKFGVEFLKNEKYVKALSKAFEWVTPAQRQNLEAIIKGKM